MIDHLLTFSDETAAQKALGDYWIEGEERDEGFWRSDVCIPNVSVYTVTSTELKTDTETNQEYETETRDILPGWFIWITLPELMDDPAVVLAADYDAYVADEPTWIVKQDPMINTDSMKISPVFSREKPYDFGSSPPPLPTSAPVNVDIPLIYSLTGINEVGHVIECTMGNWDNEPTSYAYQWKSDDVDVVGTGTGNTYTPFPSDVGHSITCIVTATNGIGSTEAPPSNVVVIEPTIEATRRRRL